MLRPSEFNDVPCRFKERGCTGHAIGIYYVPQGCHCWSDPVQALCPQHFETAESAGPIRLVQSLEAPVPCRSAEELAALCRELDRVMHDSPALSTASPVVQNAIDHLSAIARAHRVNATANAALVDKEAAVRRAADKIVVLFSEAMAETLATPTPPEQRARVTAVVAKLITEELGKAV